MNFRLFIILVLFTNGLNAQFFTAAYHGAYMPPKFITAGMVLDYELNDTRSYSGSGSTNLVDLEGNSKATL